MLMSLSTSARQPLERVVTMQNPQAHFSIGELTKEFNITPRTLRFYGEKDLIQPHRHGLERIYSRRDRGRLRLILIGKTVGFSLEEIKAMLDLYEIGDGGMMQLHVAKEKFAVQIARLEEQRVSLEAAITELKEGAAEVESRLNKL
jgi:DNA-binding transcriptional MerR regulator